MMARLSNTMSIQSFDLRRASFRFILLHFLFLVFCTFAIAQAAPAPASVPTGEGLKPILSYISSAWDTLTRSMTECVSVVDPKIKVAPVIYLPAEVAEPAAVHKLAADCNVRIEHLPAAIHRLGEIDTGKIQPHGLLYLPDKYVVPGGRFNEMYGWDSYFIIRGLLRAGRVDLARGMVDNFFFEIEHYGAMLNANRTYYLTRSQPPFVSSMFVDVYRAISRISPGWSGLTPTSTKITVCGRANRTSQARLACRVTTISAKDRPQRLCRTRADSTARWRNIFSCIRLRLTTMSSR
jgi:hypothetical protein